MPAITAHRRALATLYAPTPNYMLRWPNTLTAQNGPIVPNLSSFTFETWFQILEWSNNVPTYTGAAISGSDTEQTIYISSGSSGYANRLRVFKSGTSAYIQWYNYAGNGNATTTNIISIATNYHLRATYDAAGPSIRLDVNNVTVATQTLTGPMLPMANMFLGQIDSARSSVPLNGYMDETRVWPYVRSAAQNAISWQKRSVQLSDITTASGAWDYELKASSAFPGGYFDISGNNRGVQSSTNTYENTQVVSTMPFA